MFKERKKFYELQQNNGESVNDWYTRVKKAAVNCEFGSDLESRLKDKFVTGMREGKVLDRVCEKSHKDSVSDILETALQKEATLVKSPNQSSSDVNKLSFQNKSVSKSWGQKPHGNQFIPEQRSRNDVLQQQQQKSTKVCNHCGGLNHDFSKCKYKSYKCNACHKRGHLSKICKNSKTNANQNAHYLDNSGVEVDYISLHKIDQEETFPPILAEVVIEGKKVTMEIDSGAGISVIPFEAYKKLQLKAKIENCTRIIKTYDLRPIVPVGQIFVNVACDKKVIKNVKIIIIKENRNICLMGRDLMRKLGFTVRKIEDPIEIKKLDTSLQIQNDVKKVLDKNPELFDGQLGTLKGVKIHLDLKKDAKPVFRKPHAIPFAFKNQVESELKRLEKEGVIEKINTSDWGTPLVPTLKSNGQIRICGNYKVTVNPVLEDYRYTIPRIEDIFPALRGGEEDEETSKLLAWSTHIGLFKVKRLSFGPKSACSVFQEKIENIISGIEGCKNYFDDVIITGKNRDEHLKNLDKVLNVFRENGLKLKAGKVNSYNHGFNTWAILLIKMVCIKSLIMSRLLQN